MLSLLCMLDALENQQPAKKKKRAVSSKCHTPEAAAPASDATQPPRLAAAAEALPPQPPSVSSRGRVRKPSSRVCGLGNLLVTAARQCAC